MSRSMDSSYVGKYMSGSIQYNIVINDLLCFINNNFSMLNTNTLCRICMETYSLNDILQAYSLFKDIDKGIDDRTSTPIPAKKMTLGEQTLRKLVNIFQTQDIDSLPRFVSHGLHLPKGPSHYDNSFILPLLEEVQELKDSFIQKQQSLLNEILTLRHEIAQFTSQQNKGILCPYL